MVGIEVGGRFRAEAAVFLRKLAVVRIWEVIARLRIAPSKPDLPPSADGHNDHRRAAQTSPLHSLLELPLVGFDDAATSSRL